MMRIMNYYSPNNAHIADKIRFVANFKELHLGWTAFSAMSEGVEQFVDDHLPIIRYEFDRRRAHRLGWKHPSQILAMVEQWSIGGDYRPGRKRRVATVLPRGIQIWNTETKGHDVFTVYSKWKADPPDPDAMTSMKHPHLCYRVGPMYRKRQQN